MPAQCAICGKQRRVANNVSHSNIKTKSIQRPNLRRVHAKVGGDEHAHPGLHALPALGPRHQSRLRSPRRRAQPPVPTAIASISTMAPRGKPAT